MFAVIFCSTNPTTGGFVGNALHHRSVQVRSQIVHTWHRGPHAKTDLGRIHHHTNRKPDCVLDVHHAQMVPLLLIDDHHALQKPDRLLDEDHAPAVPHCRQDEHHATAVPDRRKDEHHALAGPDLGSIKMFTMHVRSPNASWNTWSNC